MSSELEITRLQVRYDELRAALDDTADDLAPAERERIRRGIIELFRETESAIEQLTAFKESIRELVAGYKAAAVPAASASAIRSDHLGSSTWIERGWSAIAAGEYDRAAADLRRALELSPGDSAAEGLLGWALMLDGEFDQALSLIQKVLARNPGDLVARANLGYICLKKGIFGEAIEHLSRVLRLDGDRKATLYANFYMGLVYLEREMYTDAKLFFNRALELGPNLIEAYWELGRACYLENDPSGATEVWRRGAEANRFSVWGSRCAAAVARVEAGEGVSFA